jgi:peptide-methionine (R)-S-oxide reductase
MKILLLFVSLSLLPLMACAQTAEKPQSGGPISLAAYPVVSDKVVKGEDQWKKELTAAQFDVLRMKGTERSYTGALLDEHHHGLFVCAACGNPLFSSDTKFESGTGWPSFYQPIEPNRVSQVPDNTLGDSRTEIECARCGGHLGHVFDDGPKPSGLRYCMNSAALKFVRVK